MGWLSSAPKHRLHTPGRPPEAEALRLAALHASWRRDRWVARRRVAWRWFLWYARRVGLPALLALAIALFVWLRALPALNTPDEPPAPAVALSAPALPEPAAIAAAPTTEVPPAMRATSDTATEPEITLRLDRDWANQSARRFPFAPDDSLNPSLKSDNALNSQEP